MTYRFRSLIRRVYQGVMNIMDILLLLRLLNPLMVITFSYCKIYNKTHGLLQRILRNRGIAVSMLMSMIFKVSFAISPIKFIISWSGIINKA